MGELLAERVQLRAQIAQLQEQLTALEEARQTTQQELVALKQAPFRRRRAASEAPPQRRGRAVGHPGVSRRRPTELDRTAPIPAPEQCPECGSAFTGRGVTRTRVVEDIEIRRPTIVTEFQIERRWCPTCRQYHEAPVTEALPRHRLGWHVLLFVVFQKVALGLSYGKIRRELATYFGLTVSLGELPTMVAEVARLFGPAYARLIHLMRQQAAIHIDETGWRIDGTNHWLWVFVNDVVALYVVSRSRGSKVPKALLGPDFDGVAISDFFSAYSPLETEKAKCWAHLLRDSHDLAAGKPPDSEYAHFHRELHGLFLEMGLALEAVSADPGGREQLASEMRERLPERTATPTDCAASQHDKRFGAGGDTMRCGAIMVDPFVKTLKRAVFRLGASSHPSKGLTPLVVPDSAFRPWRQAPPAGVVAPVKGSSRSAAP